MRKFTQLEQLDKKMTAYRISLGQFPGFQGTSLKLNSYLEIPL